MKLLERFDRILSELRVLFEEAAGHAEVVDKLESFLAEKGVHGRPTSSRARRRRAAPRSATKANKAKTEKTKATPPKRRAPGTKVRIRAARKSAASTANKPKAVARGKPSSRPARPASATAAPAAPPGSPG
jgi:hypothetical protein